MKNLPDVVRQIAPRCKPAYLDGLAANAGGFEKFGINTPQRQAQFLGQFLGETDGGIILQESGDYKTVDRLMQIFGAGRHSAAIQRTEAERIIALPMPQKEKSLFERVYGAGNPHMMNELGNRPGDGWPMRGTGPIQSTGRGAAKQWADRLGIAMKDDQQWMLDSKIVFMPSLFEWDVGNLNRYADIGDSRHIRRTINGGYNGYEDCEEWKDKAWAALRDPAKHPAEAWAGAAPNPGTSRIQTALNLLGYQPKLAVDGKQGPATTAAVKWFQHMNNLVEDGIAGPATLAVINLRFATVTGS